MDVFGNTIHNLVDNTDPYYESPFFIQENDVKISGISTVPNGVSKFLLIMIPPVRSNRVGPNRLFVTLAREFAKIGVASLRIDLDIEVLSRIECSANQPWNTQSLFEYYEGVIAILEKNFQLPTEVVYLGFSVSTIPLIRMANFGSRLVLISANTVTIPDTILWRDLLLIYASAEPELKDKLGRWREVLGNSPMVCCKQVVVEQAEHHFFAWSLKQHLTKVIVKWFSNLQ